jgi:alcohol dehydrogenase class IV
MHVPIEEADRARLSAVESGADSVVAFGGGSAIGLAKSIARATGLPIVALPTTFAGSEMTSVWGVTEGGKKRTGRDPKVRPRVAIYDAELVVDRPQPAAAASGLNGVAHAMEALYARDAGPMTLLYAEASVRALARNLPRPGKAATLAETSEALFGAWLAGVCLDSASMGIHHKLCHVLGGSFGLPHAETHAVMLPYTAAYNAEAAPGAMARLARALEGEAAPASLYGLAESLGAPRSLAALGMNEVDLDAAAALVLETPYDNPRPVTKESVRAMLADAFVGKELSKGAT